MFSRVHGIGLEEHISGIILYEETLYQKTEAGVPFVDILKQKGIIIGIKVDLVRPPASPSPLTCTLTCLCRVFSPSQAPTVRHSHKAGTTSAPVPRSTTNKEPALLNGTHTLMAR